MSQIVIAYAREDVAVAHALKQSLERRHYDVFLDVDGRIRGDWRQYIAERIRRATDLVVLVSPHALHSPELADEVQLGIAHARHLVPVLLAAPFDRSTTLPAPWAALLAQQAARYDPLDLTVSTDRVVALLDSRPGWLRWRDPRAWAALSAATGAAVVTAQIGLPDLSRLRDLLVEPPASVPAAAPASVPASAPDETVIGASEPGPTPPRTTGHALVLAGEVAYDRSGFSFATGQAVSWGAQRADILVSRPSGAALAGFFLPYDAGDYKDPSLDRAARAGIAATDASSLQAIDRCPPDGYKKHWVKPEVGKVYCVRWRNGDRHALIRVDTIEVDRIGFDYRLLPP
jgi:TIR domain